MTFLKNAVLVLASVLLVLVLALAADRAAGRLVDKPHLPGTMELLFPPNATQEYTSVDYTYTVHVNSLGLRERELSKKPTQAYRIAAIGDSYTYGWGVKAEETWLRLLENSLRDKGYDVETINLGKPGTGPPHYAALAEKAIPILQPDLVLVAMLQGNDLSASGPEGLGEAKTTILDSVRKVFPNFVRLAQDRLRVRSYEERTQEMPPNVSTAEDNRRWTANTAKEEFLDKMPPEHRARFDAFEDKVKDAFSEGLLNPYMIDLAMQNENFYFATFDLEDPWTKSCIERMAGQLGRIKKVAGAYGTEVVVVSVPDGPYVNEHAYRNIQRVGYRMKEGIIASDAPDQGIAAACGQAALPFAQATAAFKAKKDDPKLYFELDGHLTPEGHALYADAIADPLLERIGEDLPKR